MDGPVAAHSQETTTTTNNHNNNNNNNNYNKHQTTTKTNTMPSSLYKLSREECINFNPESVGLPNESKLTAFPNLKKG
jgi:hypothetical protein